MVTPADVYHIQKIESLIKEKIKNMKLPAGVEVEPTSFAESQEMKYAEFSNALTYGICK